MPDVLDGWIWLVIHTASAIVSLEAARRMVFASFPRLRSPELATDVWAPLAIVIPLLFLVPRVDDNVAGTGWLLFGAPPVSLVMGVGVAMIVGQRIALELRWMPIGAIGTGVLLLLLGAAHDVTMWVGQCAFAVAALLLWINTPEDDIHQPAHVSSENLRAGFGMMLMVSASIVQGLALLMMPDDVLSVAAAVAMATTTAMLAAAARLAGPSSSVRMAGWAAVFGILFGLGLISLKHLLPSMMEAMREGRTNMVHRVAKGFGEFAWEATALVAAIAIAMVQDHLPMITRRVIGFGIMFGAAFLIAWRLSSV